MSAASELIERMEAETGQRIDDNGGDNMAIAGLLGTMSRMMGESPESYTEADDVAAGVLLRHQMSPAGQRDRLGRDLMVALLTSGMSPENAKALLG